MLVTFRCDAYEDITLFGNVAVRLLKMMGQSGVVPGAILADDVSDALKNLQSALQHEPQRSAPKINDEDEEEISIAKRALPVIALLTAAAKAHSDVMWS